MLVWDLTWTRKRKAHIKEVPSCHSGIRLASLVSWDLIGIGSILFLRYVGKFPRSQERHGYEEKDFFQVFFLCWERVSLLGRERVSGLNYLNSPRRWLSQRSIAVLLFGNFYRLVVCEVLCDPWDPHWSEHGLKLRD